jgi:hypothetical protein
MNKILSALFVALMVVTLVSCGKTATTETTTTTTPDTTTTTPATTTSTGAVQ